jgi:hypothetical protein
MSLAKDVIDEVVRTLVGDVRYATIEAGYIVPDPALPAIVSPKTVKRYGRPRAVLPTDCPVLCVWMANKLRTPVETDPVHDARLVIGASWQIETIEEARTLVDDEANEIELLARMQDIERHVMKLAEDGWDVAGAWQITAGDSSYFRTPEGLEQGVTEGYALEVLVDVTERGE